MLFEGAPGGDEPGRQAPCGADGRWRRVAAFQGPLLESTLPVIKLLLLALSGAKLGKLFASGGTMLVSLVVDAFIFGWRFATGFIALPLANEMGHYVAARRRDLAVGLPTFIPFVDFGLAGYLAFMAYRTHSIASPSAW